MGILTGVDIIEIARIKKAIESLGDKFLKRIYTKDEVEYCESKKASRFQSYAVRFAAKEAVSKAIGTGISDNIWFNEIEIYNDASGAPKVKLNGSINIKATELKINNIEVTLSHCKTYAVAFVIATT